VPTACLLKEYLAVLLNPAADPVVDQTSSDVSGGGTLGNSSALNHLASTISSPSIWISPDNHVAKKPIINEWGNGHGWLAEIADMANLHANLFSDLAPHRLLERFAWFCEPGQGRVHPLESATLARRSASSRSTMTMMAGASRG